VAAEVWEVVAAAARVAMEVWVAGLVVVATEEA
jgi:hypothetical protein